jgi:hypothetical protein
MIATVISAVALVVSAFSFFVASERFRLDLYNKRFDIYVRTVTFYQYFMKSETDKTDEHFFKLTSDFIIATRESRFLFSPKSGVYDQLNKLKEAYFVIRGNDELTPDGMPTDVLLNRHKQRSDALSLWNFGGIERLEDLMSPYLDYHYNVSVTTIIRWAKQHWKRRTL